MAVQGTAFHLRPTAQAVRILETPAVRGGRALGLGLGLVDRDVATLHISAIEALDRRIGLRVVVHFDEAEALGLTGELVGNEVDLLDLPKLGESVAQIRIGDIVREVTYIDVHIGLSLKYRALNEVDTIEKTKHENSFDSGMPV
jgi:hypothetical protein